MDPIRVLVRMHKHGGEGNYVLPIIAEINHDADIVKHEIFGPILYVFKFSTLDLGLENKPFLLEMASGGSDINSLMRIFGTSESSILTLQRHAKRSSHLLNSSAQYLQISTPS